MAIVGYARVSSVGQSLDVQLDKLKHCDKIYQEKQSGTNQKRPELKACLEYVREGDTSQGYVFKIHPGAGEKSGIKLP